jgi:hypothetical protein
MQLHSPQKEILTEPLIIIAGSPVVFSSYDMEHKEIVGWIHHPFRLSPHSQYGQVLSL